jgi:acetyl-CoA synthetase
MRYFRWPSLDHFNVAEAILHRNDDSRVALIEAREAGENIYTFGAMDFFSDKFANALAAVGVKQTGAVAVMLPQSAALAVAHLGVLKMGCAVVPLAEDLSASSLEHAISDSRAKAIVISRDSRARLDSISNLKSLEAIFVAGELDEDLADRHFWREVYAASSDFAIMETRVDMPAFIFYKDDKAGFVYGHSLLMGSLPAFEMINDFDLDDAFFYTPLKWAGAETLFGFLYPAWFYGLPVVARESGDMLAVAERYRVTNLMVSSTDLEESQKRYDLCIRNIYSINEVLPGWAKKIDATFASAYGSEEAPMIMATCERWFSAPVDSRGRAAPGHRIEVIDESGRMLPPGKSGQIVLRKPDPSMFLRRCGEPLADDASEWFPVARGFKDEDGSLWLAPTQERSS